MVSSRREFLAGVGGLGLGGLLLTPDGLGAEDRQGEDSSKQKGKPTMRMVIETVFTEGLAQLSDLIGDKANKTLPPRDLQVLDVRTPNEWQDGHMPGATYIFLPRLEKKLDSLDKGKPVAVYCDSGYRASLAASLLQRHGFTHVRNVPGSWKAWKAAGFEVAKPKGRKKASETDLS